MTKTRSTTYDILTAMENSLHLLPPAIANKKDDKDKKLLLQEIEKLRTKLNRLEEKYISFGHKQIEQGVNYYQNFIQQKLDALQNVALLQKEAERLGRQAALFKKVSTKNQQTDETKDALTKETDININTQSLHSSIMLDVSDENYADNNEENFSRLRKSI